jgi:hypothetical protein
MQTATIIKMWLFLKYVLERKYAYNSGGLKAGLQKFNLHLMAS